MHIQLGQWLNIYGVASLVKYFFSEEIFFIYFL